MKVENKLVPIMRDGVDIIKMIFFKKLKEHLARKYTAVDAGRLAGAIVNEVFGPPADVKTPGPFADKNRAIVEQELGELAETLSEMRIPLTDALRMQALCDHQQGIDSTATLVRAKKLGVLVVERDLPLPSTFLHLVRKLGSAFGLLAPPRQNESLP